LILGKPKVRNCSFKENCFWRIETILKPINVKNSISTFEMVEEAMIHRHIYVGYTFVPPHRNATCGFFSFSLLCVLCVIFWLVVKRMVQCVYKKKVSHEKCFLLLYRKMVWVMQWECDKWNMALFFNLALRLHWLPEGIWLCSLNQSTGPILIIESFC